VALHKGSWRGLWDGHEAFWAESSPVIYAPQGCLAHYNYGDASISQAPLDVCCMPLASSWNTTLLMSLSSMEPRC